jgi:hypothetical protein
MAASRDDDQGFFRGSFFSTTVVGKRGMPDFQIVTFSVEGAGADLKTLSYEQIINAYGKIFESIEPARQSELKSGFIDRLIYNDFIQSVPADVYASMTFPSSLRGCIGEFVEDFSGVIEIPIKNSPLGSIDLKTLLLGVTSSSGIVLGSFTTDHNPVVVVAMVGASIVILGAARGVGEALRRGLYVKTLELLKVPERSTGSTRRKRVRMAS